MANDGRRAAVEVTPNGVYFLAWEGSRPSERKYSLQLLRLDTGQVEQVASLGEVRVLDHGCSISPDGKWLLYVQDGEKETDIAVLRDFH
jgi:hypothetical protein